VKTTAALGVISHDAPNPVDLNSECTSSRPVRVRATGPLPPFALVHGLQRAMGISRPSATRSGLSFCGPRKCLFSALPGLVPGPHCARQYEELTVRSLRAQ
jgi:hypothetical protein